MEHLWKKFFKGGLSGQIEAYQVAKALFIGNKKTEEAQPTQNVEITENIIENIVKNLITNILKQSTPTQPQNDIVDQNDESALSTSATSSTIPDKKAVKPIKQKKPRNTRRKKQNGS
jgi:hypothetical protein